MGHQVSMSRWFRRCAGVLGASALCCLAGVARAHGGIPRANVIAFEPGNPGHVVFETAYIGLFQTLDAWSTVELRCPLTWGHSANGGWDVVPLAMIPGGRVVMAAGYSGLQIVEPMCRQMPPVLQDFSEDFVDVQVSRDGQTLYVLSTVSADAGATGKLTRSTDGAASFTTVAEFPIIPVSMALAASDPKRIYVLGYRVSAGFAASTAVVLRSSDGGATWKELPGPIPMGSDASTMAQYTMRRAVVSPVDPDMMFVTADNVTDLSTVHGALSVTFDGGATYLGVYSTQAGDPLAEPVSVPGLAFSPDGSEVVFGTPYNGLFHAEVATLKDSQATTFMHVSDRRIWGLTWTTQGLYAGCDDFSATDERFMLGVSHDSGRTFSKVYGICDVAPSSCTACATLVAHEQSDLGTRCSFDGGKWSPPPPGSSSPPLPTPDGGATSGSSAPAGSNASASDSGVGPNSASLDIKTGCAMSAGERGDSWFIMITNAVVLSMVKRRRRQRWEPTR